MICRRGSGGSFTLTTTIDQKHTILHFKFYNKKKTNIYTLVNVRTNRECIPSEMEKRKIYKEKKIICICKLVASEMFHFTCMSHSNASASALSGAIFKNWLFSNNLIKTFSSPSKLFVFYVTIYYDLIYIPTLKYEYSFRMRSRLLA